MSLVVGLVLGEGAMRLSGWQRGIDYRLFLAQLADPSPLSQLWIERPPGGWRRVPPFRAGVESVASTADFAISYRINDKGFRDGNHTYERSSGGQRYLALGDSYTFGSGVAYGERFTDLIGRELRDVEVVNFGVPGYGVDDALMSYLLEGRRYSPDVVLLFVHQAMARRNNAGIYRNGLVEIPEKYESWRSRARSDSETVYLAAEDPLRRAALNPVLRQSYLLSYAWYRFELWRRSEELFSTSRRGFRPKPRPRVDIVVEEPDERQRLRTRLLVERLANECRKDGCTVLVVNIDQYYSSDYLRDVPGAELLDLSSELYRLGREGNLRFDYDRHYNSQTHAFIAAKVAEAISARNGTRPVRARDRVGLEEATSGSR